ncbi:MAG: hypothetical protein NTW27_12250 [Deltaproteobacteria bacterium]|nr:hypothetical protein [Deltaproteobacteria bacterium]
MHVKVTAPNRIDLAGGTTDLHPLYLFLDGGCTVNLAITVCSSVTVRVQSQPAISILSEDLGQSVRSTDLANLDTRGPLGLVAKTVKTLKPDTGLDIVTRNQAPTGSGLGASSALITALLAGLLKLGGVEKSPEEIIRLATNIETSVIGVPAGSQDHIASFYGGISLIDFGYHGFARREFFLESATKNLLEDLIILSYTGEGRFSGMNNWDIIKGFIDNKESTRERLIQIRDVAREMCDAFVAGNLDNLPSLLNREWELRRTLAAGITNARIDGLMDSAVRAGAMANKICGAGGGGCMITLVEKQSRSAVEQAIVAEGGLIIPFKIDVGGIVVTCN